MNTVFRNSRLYTLLRNISSFLHVTYNFGLDLLKTTLIYPNTILRLHWMRSHLWLRVRAMPEHKKNDRMTEERQTGMQTEERKKERKKKRGKTKQKTIQHIQQHQHQTTKRRKERKTETKQNKAKHKERKERKKRKEGMKKEKKERNIQCDKTHIIHTQTR